MDQASPLRYGLRVEGKDPIIVVVVEVRQFMTQLLAD